MTPPIRMVSVPVEPTKAMLAAAATSDWLYKDDVASTIWSAMLTAAPVREEGGAGPGGYLVKDFADGWYWTPNAALDHAGGAPVWSVADSRYETEPPALATREEAPAEAGEWITGDHLHEIMQSFTDRADVSEIAAKINAAIALRSQLPTREDAQPVAGVDVLFARAAAMRAMLDRLNVRNTNSLTDGQLAAEYQRLHAHPAPDALRDAVEALEEIADTDPDDGTSWFHERANQALAALQAEQGAK